MRAASIKAVNTALMFLNDVHNLATNTIAVTAKRVAKSSSNKICRAYSNSYTYRFSVRGMQNKRLRRAIRSQEGRAGIIIRDRQCNYANAVCISGVLPCWQSRESNDKLCGQFIRRAAADQRRAVVSVNVFGIDNLILCSFVYLFAKL